MENKTTLEDIGESLDEMILESKARYGQYYHGSKHFGNVPEIATNNSGSQQLDWRGKLFDEMDDAKPTWFDDDADKVFEHAYDYEK